MRGDALASGQKSAQFSGGHAAKDDPVEFHGTVAAVDSHTVERDVYQDWMKRNPQPLVEEPAPVTDFSKYQPMNDRVLLRRIAAKNENLIQRPDAFVQASDIGQVLGGGEGMLIGGVLRPINLQPGDKVRFGHYNAEEIEVEGEKLVLVSAFDVRLKIKP